MKKLVIPQSTLNNVVTEAMERLTPTIEESFASVVLQIKKQMIDEFMDHPVTEEILNGKSASNSSGTLQGYGNLFTFIGFEEFSSPLMPIIELLERTDVEVKYSKRSSIVRVVIYMPTAQDIFKATPLDWANGRSWAKGIESGLSGLGYYINSYASGRSGAGVQTKTKVRGGRFKNTPYISSLMNKYTALFSGINGANIKIKRLKTA
jgi:hypothetical protein